MVVCTCGEIVQRGADKCNNCGRQMRVCRCGLEITSNNPEYTCENCDARFCYYFEFIFRKGVPRQPTERVQCNKCYEEWKKGEDRFKAGPPSTPSKDTDWVSPFATSSGGMLDPGLLKLNTDEDKIIENSIGMKMRLIEPGVFLMGEDPPDGSFYVNITKPFYIGVYPVTQGEWKQVIGENPSEFKGDSHPVESVSWLDCQFFIQKLSQLEPGSKYRSPTNAEWEYACRAGTLGTYYFDESEDRSVYIWSDRETTCSVGTLKPNAWGLYDMLGNVSEWCLDAYLYQYKYQFFDKGYVYDPLYQGKKGDDRYTIRGGSYRHSQDTKCHYFNGEDSGTRSKEIGFRLVKTLEGPS